VGRAGEAAGVLHLRTSIGRARESHTLDFTDGELVAQSLADLAEATGLRAAPVDTHVQRWVQGLPQYAVGHLDRVARVRAAIADLAGRSRGNLAVAGAAYDGVGIPAVIASARRAVDDLLGGR
jgi:oxygen-dependent protoporphyrinogen oxidase